MKPHISIAHAYTHVEPAPTPIPKGIVMRFTPRDLISEHVIDRMPEEARVLLDVPLRLPGHDGVVVHSGFPSSPLLPKSYDAAPAEFQSSPRVSPTRFGSNPLNSSTHSPSRRRVAPNIAAALQSCQRLERLCDQSQVTPLISLPKSDLVELAVRIGAITASSSGTSGPLGTFNSTNSPPGSKVDVSTRFLGAVSNAIQQPRLVPSQSRISCATSTTFEPFLSHEPIRPRPRHPRSVRPPPETQLIQTLARAELNKLPLPETKQLEGDIQTAPWLPPKSRSYVKSERDRHSYKGRRGVHARLEHKSSGVDKCGNLADQTSSNDRSGITAIAEVVSEPPVPLPTLPPLPHFDLHATPLRSANRGGPNAPMHKRVLKPTLSKYRHADALGDALKERELATLALIKKIEDQKRNQGSTQSVEDLKLPVSTPIIPLQHAEFDYLGDDFQVQSMDRGLRTKRHLVENASTLAPTGRLTNHHVNGEQIGPKQALLISNADFKINTLKTPVE